MTARNVPATGLRQWRLFLAALAEPLLRGIAWAMLPFGRDREGTELALRGLLLGGSARWRIGRNVRFVGPSRRIRMGCGVCLYGNTYLNANGSEGGIEIGSGSHVDQFCVLYGQGGLTIGSDCAIASGTIIYSQSNQDVLEDGTPVARQPARYARVTIGSGSWLGAGVRVLPGTTLGAGVHVGAGAVVMGDSPAFAVIVGVPGRVLRIRAAGPGVEASPAPHGDPAGNDTGSTE